MDGKVKANEESGADTRISTSLIPGGCIIGEGAYVMKCVVSPFVVAERGAHVESSILMKGVTVGEKAQIKNEIIDEGITIPPHYLIGYNEKEDKRRFGVSDSGTVVVPEGCILD